MLRLQSSVLGGLWDNAKEIMLVSGRRESSPYDYLFEYLRQLDHDSEPDLRL